jgi:ATP-dependent helicase/DNAse subunit B
MPTEETPLLNSLVIIRGSLAALEARLAADVAERRQRDPLAALTILVGSTLLRPYLRRRLTELCGGLINLRLMTFDDLSGNLAALAAALSKLTPLPSYGERIIAEETAMHARGYFQAVGHTSGFAQALDRLLRDVRHAGLDPASLTAAVDAMNAADAISAEKLAALAQLFMQAEERRARFYGRDNLIRLADAARYHDAELLIYGVWDFTTIQRQMLERLMERVALTIYLPDGQGNTDEAHTALREWLTRHGATEETLEDGVTGETALHQLQRQIFASPTGSAAPDDGTVRLLSAPDTPREVREAARACLRWASEGIAFHDMAVVYRQPEQYRGLIDEIFREARIPLYLHDGSPLIERPIGRSLAALLTLIGSRLTRASVMEFLTETTLPSTSPERQGEFEPAAWDQLSREAGIVEGREQWLDRLIHLQLSLERSFSSDDTGLSERTVIKVEEIKRMRSFVGEFFAHLDEWPEHDSWEGFRERLRTLASDYIEGVEPVIDALEELDQLGVVAESITYSRFVRAVRAALQQIDSRQVFDEPSGAFGRFGVNVLNVNSLRHLRFRAVILLGLTERSFPPPPRQDALLLDDERRALNQLINGEIPLRSTGPDVEPLQFTLALAAARERLILSYARGDAGGGRSHLPSYFYRAVAGTLTGAAVRIADIDRLDPAIFERVPANRFGAARPEEALTANEFDRTLMGLDPDLGQACLLQRSASFGRSRRAWEARWRNSALTAWDGVLDPTLRDAISGSARLTKVLSPTRLETYATCPYRFYLQSILGLAEVEEPEAVERISALDRGSLIHTILNHFLAESQAELPPDDTTLEMLRARLLATAAEACDEWEQRGAAGYALLWEFDKAAIFEDLETWFEREIATFRPGGLLPQAFEVRFGTNWFGNTEEEDGFSVDEPVTVPIETGELRFQGRIDRIDWNADRSTFRVIDYKTGRAASYTPERFSQGTRLQLPIYLLAASHALRRHGIDIPWQAGEAEYAFPTRRGEFKHVRFSGSTLTRRWDEFEQLLDDLSGQIARGDFHPEPGDKGANCTYCPGRHVCDQRIVRISTRKAEAREPRFLRIQQVE